MICQKVHIHHNSFMISSQNGQAGEEASWWNNGRAKYASTTKLAWFVKTTGNRSLLICRFSPQVKAICYGCPPVFLSSDGSGVEEDVLAVSSVGLNWSNYIYQLPHPVFSAKKVVFDQLHRVVFIYLACFLFSMYCMEGRGCEGVRPQRSIKTIASFDQWSGTIKNHWKRW